MSSLRPSEGLAKGQLDAHLRITNLKTNLFIEATPESHFVC
jgi:hypothetical protein